MNPPIRVLCVDDERSFLELARIMLDRYGEMHIETASSGKEALEVLSRERFDVILADYVMPGMNGIELLRALRGRGDETPYIVFTGKGRESVAMDALNSGADLYIQKGTDTRAQFTELLMMIRKLASYHRESLEEKERRGIQDMLLEADIVALVAFDVNGRVTLWNRGVERITGLGRNDVIGRTVTDLSSFVREEGVEAHLRKVMAGQRVELQDLSFDIPETGCKGHFKTFTGPIRGVSGEVMGGFALLVDTTEERAKDDALEAIETRYRAVFDNAGDAIFIHHPDGRFIDVNAVACASLGYSRDELLGMRVQEINDTRDAELVAPRVEELLRTGSGFFEVLHVRKDGTRIPVEVNVRVVDHEGAPTFMTIARDVSERKATLEALQRASDKLKLLDAITRHDIVNQLVVLSGYLDMTSKSEANSKLKGYVDRAREAAEAIGDHLEFAKDYQRAGRAAPEWLWLDIVIDSAVTTLDVTDIGVEKEVGGLEVLADPMLEKVFINLIDNARRHGEKVTRVRVSYETRDSDLVIVVEDDGAGIPPEEKELIFERGHGRNTGLGLFLIREVLGITGFKIAEKGVLGEGARFEITIPPGSFRFRS